MHIKPCETVGKVISPGNPDLPIALSIRTACSVSWFAARQLACPYPSEQSGFRCVVQNLLQLRLGNHYFSFFHSGLGTSQPDPVMRHHHIRTCGNRTRVLSASRLICRLTCGLLVIPTKPCCPDVMALNSARLDVLPELPANDQRYVPRISGAKSLRDLG